ncbi:hypothetical protein EI94DRAFT_392575 [Lactarius quietus]|nr:hypothetical protein EI94DRAFT_392575 [Lactarius quietus]
MIHPIFHSQRVHTIDSWTTNNESQNTESMTVAMLSERLHSFRRSGSEPIAAGGPKSHLSSGSGSRIVVTGVELESIAPGNVSQRTFGLRQQSSTTSSAPSHSQPSSGHSSRPSTSTSTYQKHPYARIPFTDSDGYLVRMFGTRDAASLIELLLKMNARDVHLIENVPNFPNALMVSRSSVSDAQPDAVANNQHRDSLWLIDFVPQPRFSVVPQQIWSPPNQSYGRRYVKQAHLHMPVFFMQNNGVIGFPLSPTAFGDTTLLRNGNRAAPLGGPGTVFIRIAWPGYESWQSQIMVRDQTPSHKEITLEKFAKRVASSVARFIEEHVTADTRDPVWQLGNGHITRNDVIIVGTVQVSIGSWMPILQIVERV